jgi:phospholipase/carboxylesterase
MANPVKKEEENDYGEFVHVHLPGSSPRVLLLLHGTGGDESSLIPLSRMIDPAAAILAVRGKVLENGAPRFFRRFSEGVFDIEDLKFRTQELAEFISSASRRYNFSSDDLIAVGYSNGANIGAALMILRPNAIGRAILFRPVLPLVPSSVPDLTRKSVFISSGTHDAMTPRDKVLQLQSLLKGAGAEVVLNWEPASHSLTQDDIEKARAWLS